MVLLVALAVLAAVLVKAFLVQAFYIPSESMEPGLVPDDRILVEKPSYWFGSPQRGDVVVFQDPGGWLEPSEETQPGNPLTSALSHLGLYPTGGHLVKRVIGVAGDTVHCCDAQGRLQVNGQPLDEGGYVKNEAGVPCRGPMIPGCDWTAGPVPPGRLFVMGDNRNHSGDSSEHLCQPIETDCVAADAYVPVDLVVGRVFAVVWPWSHATWLHRPATFADVPNQ